MRPGLLGSGGFPISKPVLEISDVRKKGFHAVKKQSEIIRCAVALVML